MSDMSTGYSPGTGAQAGVDRIDGVDFPKVKLVVGPAGTAAHVATGAGASSAATLRSVAASDSPEVAALASILAKIIAAPATEAKQDALAALVTTIDGVLDSILAKLSADPSTATGQAAIITAIGAVVTALAQTLTVGGTVAVTGVATEAKQDTLIAKDFATQTTLAAVLAKIIAAPSTEAKQDALNTLVTTIDGVLDSILAKLSADPATQTTSAAILAKLIAAPATEAKQDTLIAKDFATQTTLASILAKIIAAPATEAKQDTGNSSLSTIAGKDFATQTTLAAVLAKIIAAPATEAKQDTQITALGLLTTGRSVSRQMDLDETKHQVKGAAGVLHGLIIGNSYDGPVYVHIYDALAANVTVGTTTPLATIEVPKRYGASDPIAISPDLTFAGIACATAITLACTTTYDGAVGPGANEVKCNAIYR